MIFFGDATFKIFNDIHSKSNWMRKFDRKRKIVYKIHVYGRTFIFDLDYFKENWGAIFIIFFQFLLVFSAVLLVQGYEYAANELAIYAFYSLVLGVVLQFASYLKYGESKDYD